MARINTNVASLAARTNLIRAQSTLNQSMQRLSSGVRINRGADDPAGLIASETLRSEIGGIKSAIDNSQRASNVIATAEGALNEVANLLINIKQLAVQAASPGGFSPAEVKANQLQVDSAVASITRIANVTNFAGLNLLDGSLDYRLSGVTNSQISAMHVYNAQLGSATTMPVDVNIVQSARTAILQWRHKTQATAVTLQVAGNDGVETITIGSNTSQGTIITAINNLKDSTGVSAIALSAATGSATSGVLFYSTGWGSSAFVSVKPMTGGTFDTKDMAGALTEQTFGRDVGATINGNYIVGDGLNLSLNSTYLSLDLTLDAGLGVTPTSFTIAGGGALFQLGPHISMNEQRSIGIQSISATNLGNSVVGFLSQVMMGGDYSLGKNASQASKVADECIQQVASLRGRLGAFEKNTLQTNISSLEVSLENITASESSIRDADFAAETSNLTRGQILTQAATSVLAIANSTPQSVLALLQ